MYVVLEGVDTVGKSTQIELLSKKFPNSITTKEPGGTEFGIELRKSLLESKQLDAKSELFLFLADRSAHYDQIIKPNLNKLIISDRSLVSGIAYADSLNIFDFEWLIELNKFALDNRLPDKMVLLEISKDELTKRLSEKKNDRIEKRGIEYMLSVQSMMKNIAQKLNIEILVVDASKSIEDIHKNIYNFLS